MLYFRLARRVQNLIVDMDEDENRVRSARDYLTRLMRGTTVVVHLQVGYNKLVSQKRF